MEWACAQKRGSMNCIETSVLQHRRAIHGGKEPSQPFSSFICSTNLYTLPTLLWRELSRLQWKIVQRGLRTSKEQVTTGYEAFCDGGMGGKWASVAEVMKSGMGEQQRKGLDKAWGWSWPPEFSRGVALQTMKNLTYFLPKICVLLRRI